MAVPALMSVWDRCWLLSGSMYLVLGSQGSPSGGCRASVWWPTEDVRGEGSLSGIQGGMPTGSGFSFWMEPEDEMLGMAAFWAFQDDLPWKALLMVISGMLLSSHTVLPTGSSSFRVT